jgi:TPR repeat protein
MYKPPEHTLAPSPLDSLGSPLSFGRPDERDYELVPADAAQVSEVLHYWRSHAPVDKEIRSIEVIHNPVLSFAFQLQSRKLQKQAHKHAFVPTWENECQHETEKTFRKQIYGQFELLTLPHRNENYPDVKFLKGWHGTRPEVAGSIFETGYVNLAKLDSGFFGKGIYLTPEVNYAVKYAQGALILNDVAAFAVYPVIFEDMQRLYGAPNYRNHDTHFVLVVPRTIHANEVNFDAIRVGQVPSYTEIVSFQSASVLPRYLVTLQSLAIKLSSLGPLEQGEEKKLENPLENYLKALKLKNEKKFDMAIFYLQQAANCNVALAHYELGWCYRKGEGVQQDFGKAISSYQSAAMLDLASAHHELGFCYKRGEGTAKDPQAAVAQFQLALAKGYTPAAYELAWHYATGKGLAKDSSKAVEHFKKAAEGGMVAAQFHLACRYEEGIGTAKDLKRAKKYYQLAASKGHEDAAIHLANLEKAERLKKETKLSSLSTFFKVPEMALLKEAQVHMQQHRYIAAMDYLNKLIQEAPTSGEYYHLRAKCLLGLKRYQEAVQDFDSAICFRPDHVQSYVERGFTHENQQNNQGALLDYDKALALNSQHAFALCRRGGLHFRLGNFAQGEVDFKTSIALKSDDPHTYRHRGEQYLLLGRYADAISDFNETLRLRPQWYDVQALKAEATSLQADPSQEKHAADRPLKC